MCGERNLRLAILTNLRYRVKVNLVYIPLNMFKAGLDILCYNFMPVVDWTRTDLEFEYNDGSNALKFDFDAFAAFDIFLMRRSNAQKDYTERQLERYILKLLST